MPRSNPWAIRLAAFASSGWSQQSSLDYSCCEANFNCGDWDYIFHIWESNWTWPGAWYSCPAPSGPLGSIDLQYSSVHPAIHLSMNVFIQFLYPSNLVKQNVGRPRAQLILSKQCQCVASGFTCAYLLYFTIVLVAKKLYQICLIWSKLQLLTF